MGCDIHLILEIKIEGKWRFGGILDMDRNYEIFSRMARCGRNIDTEPIVENKGLPDDIDDISKIVIEDSADHSASWFNSEEVFQLAKENPQLDMYGNEGVGTMCPFGGAWASNWRMTNYYGFEDFRWIFGFDN